MPRLRELPQSRIPDRTETVSRQPHPAAFKKGHAKLGGRPPGQGNFFSLGIRESILTALSNCGGERGLVGFIEQAVQEDRGYGIKLLVALAPRQADVTVRNAPSVTTLQELDERLAQMNLPPARDIFSLDFKGDPVEDADEAEVVAAEDTAKE